MFIADSCISANNCRKLLLNELCGEISLLLNTSSSISLFSCWSPLQTKVSDLPTTQIEGFDREINYEKMTNKIIFVAD